jgi:hypothetical protein
MKVRHLIHSVLVLSVLAAVSLSALRGDVQAEEWNIGKVTAVSENSLRIDGRTFFVNRPFVLRDTGRDVLPSDLNLLRGTSQILFRLDRDGRIVEIRIFKRKQ